MRKNPAKNCRRNAETDCNKAISRDGAEFSIHGDTWKIRSASALRSFSFHRVNKYATRDLIESIKKLILNQIENYSIDTAKKSLEVILHFIYFSGSRYNIKEITLSDLLSYKTTLRPDTEWHLGRLRTSLYRWHDLRLPGLAPDVVTALKKMRLKGTRKGDAVRSLDPRKGPFSDIEFQAIISALNDAFAQGGVSRHDYILVWLFLAIGARPVQLAALKLSDFSVVRASDGSSAYILQVPRAKQRGQAPRTEFKPRTLLPEIGDIISEHCEATLCHWRRLRLGDAQAAPFFINAQNSDGIPILRFHCTGHELGLKVSRIFNNMHVISERTGEAMAVITRRFRYTVGTRAAAEGASEIVIAELLDHSDTQHVAVYVEAVPDIVERIDRGLAIHLAPMAQAFAGVLVEHEEDAIRGNDPRSRIVSPADLTRPVGNCGSYSFCGAAAPHACYTCRNFQPWIDGPHEEILEKLIADRERITNETNDVRIAAVNDRLIFACAEVVRLCKERETGATT